MTVLMKFKRTPVSCPLDLSTHPGHVFQDPFSMGETAYPEELGHYV